MHPALNIIIKAARRASQIINRASLDLEHLQVTTKRQSDFVTEVDKAAEAAIIDVLREAYPGVRHSSRRVGPDRRQRRRQRVSVDHRPARRHHQLHPRISRSTRSRSRWRTAGRSRKRWSTTRYATKCSPPARAAAPSSTNAASGSANACARRSADRHRFPLPHL
jgi:hypothetical protein